MKKNGFPLAQGLYDSAYEKDSCGVGFVCNVDGIPSHEIVLKGIEVLKNMNHRGAVGADPLTGDGAGILIEIPDEFLRKKAKEEKVESG